MSLLEIRIDNVKQVQDEFRDIAANQIPFATALALTMTAQAGQHSVQESILPGHFTLRRSAFMKQGIRIQAATKANLAAVVQDIHAFMEAQEETGLKIPYGRAIAIPLRGARPTMGALIAKNNLPHAVMARGGFIRNNVMYDVVEKFKVRGPGRGKAGPKYAVRQPNKIVAMYFLAPEWKWNPRYGFAENVKLIVEQTFELNFRQAFARAVRTARK